MALGNYTQLQAAITSWLYERADLVTAIPDFVTLAEAKFNRRLKTREMHARVTADTNPSAAYPQFVSLPSDFLSMRYVRLNGTNGWKRLRFATPAQMSDLRERDDDTPGEPVWFCVVGDELELLPTPNLVREMEMGYFKKIPGLAANSTNWLLTDAPDIYLNGALMEAAPYLYDDARIPMWEKKLNDGIAELNLLSEQAEYNAGPLVRRTNRRSYS